MGLYRKKKGTLIYLLSQGYRKKLLTFECEQLTVPREINFPDGGIQWGDIGDWMLTAPTGEAFFCNPKLFEAVYEPADNKVMD